MHYLKNVIRQVARSRAYLAVTKIVESLVVGLVLTMTPKAQRTRRYHLLLPTNGGGNIGDQAMFEAYLQNVEGPVVAILRHEGALRVPDWHKSNVRIVTLPRLVGGLPTLRIRTMHTFAKLLTEAASFSIVGADIMDGGYDRRESVFRSRAASIAARFDVPARVLGFSWNGRADKPTADALRAASATTQLIVRDVLSYQRLVDARMQNVVEGADAVFVLDVDEATAAHDEWIDSAATPVVILNVSGLIAQRSDLSEDYDRIVGQLLRDGNRVLVLPHVVRDGDNDLDACRAVAARFDSEHVRLVESVLTPGQVSELAAKAAFAISGRMHLAILSMNRGTPCITMSTQGKVEGLLRMLGIQDFCVEPAEGMSNQVLAILSEGGLRVADARRSLPSHLPAVREMARLNYDGMQELIKAPALR